MGSVENLGVPLRAANDLLGKLQSPFLLALRVYVAWVFLKSGLQKIGDWDTTLWLFENEYHTPLLNYELAAYLGTFGELVFPVFLISGFGTRFFALGLTVVNVMAVLSYYATLAKGAGLVWHYLWALMLFTNIIYGGGFFAVDQWLKAKFGNPDQAD